MLAGTGITNTGSTTVSGTAGSDIGSAPTGTFTGSADGANSVTNNSGTNYTAVDPKVEAAKLALVTAYDDAAGRTPATQTDTELGGKTLVAGVYSAGTMAITGVLTLDGENNPNAVFIFQSADTLTTASGPDASSVNLINGAQACNVFWQVASSATFGTDSKFVGHVFALTSIAAQTRATFNGQLLARNGTVTLDTNTIVNDLCAAVATATPAPAAETATPEPVTETEDGGQLPRTDNSWVLPFVVGVILLAGGTVYMVLRRRRI